MALAEYMQFCKIDSIRVIALLIVFAFLGGCASAPLMPYTREMPPLMLVPVAQANVTDGRARFREVFCAVLDARKDEIPDYRPCDEALTRVGAEPDATALPPTLEPSRRRLILAAVMGFGYDCFESWLEPTDTIKAHLQKHGYDLTLIPVEGLSGTERNASLIRDALNELPMESGPPRIVLLGYSKGASDVLEALVAYPELHSRLAAVVSAAGTIGGSPIANDTDQNLAEWLRYFPGSECTPGDRGAVASLQPDTRQTWLATHALPQQLPFYSLVTFPDPDRISSILKKPYRKLSAVDTRNDSQVIFYDQVIPGSTLLGYLNADHWAIAVPVGRTHETIATLFVTENAYPREALAEALLRFIEEDLDAQAMQSNE